jgi:hypothetical protein
MMFQIRPAQMALPFWMNTTFAAAGGNHHQIAIFDFRED